LWQGKKAIKNGQFLKRAQAEFISRESITGDSVAVGSLTNCVNKFFA